jgi:hypothetical protein
MNCLRDPTSQDTGTGNPVPLPPFCPSLATGLKRRITSSAESRSPDLVSHGPRLTWEYLNLPSHSILDGNPSLTDQKSHDSSGIISPTDAHGPSRPPLLSGPYDTLAAPFAALTLTISIICLSNVALRQSLTTVLRRSARPETVSERYNYQDPLKNTPS